MIASRPCGAHEHARLLSTILSLGRLSRLAVARRGRIVWNGTNISTSASIDGKPCRFRVWLKGVREPRVRTFLRQGIARVHRWYWARH